MNPISKRIHTGAVGELLVQVRLLQYGVQAAPPIKDSGNDLIAVRGDIFRAVQVRTTTNGTFAKPKRQRRYHVLAVVRLRGGDNDLFLDRSDVFLVPVEAVPELPANCNKLEGFKISEDLVRHLFGE